MNKFSDDQMLSDIVYCADLCLNSLTSPDNNVIVAALELLQVIVFLAKTKPLRLSFQTTWIT